MAFDGVWPWLWAAGGLLSGSFLNVLIHRWPLMLAAESDGPAGAAHSHPLNLAWPRSHCPHCHTPLTVWQLIPVLSFVWLGGRCGHCRQPIAWRYPVVELLNMAWWLWCGLALPAWLAALPQPTALAGVPSGLTWGPSLAWSLWGSTVLALAWIDWDSTWLPDGLTQPLAWGGLVAAGLGWSGLPL
ncbi:MAG: Type 4 prepilin-like protein leader peptide-processing enzyme, partial [Pseudomonadota bacterium]